MRLILFQGYFTDRKPLQSNTQTYDQKLFSAKQRVLLLPCSFFPPTVLISTYQAHWLINQLQPSLRAHKAKTQTKKAQ